MASHSWASGLIPLGRLYLRPLQRYFHSLSLTDRFMPPRQSDPSVLASLLQHWQDLSFLTSGIPIRPFHADFTIFTDALTQGWGAHMGDSQISGTWAPLDRQLHINCLELKAVEAALHHWAPVLQGHQVMIATDNSTVVSYINKQGGTRSHTLLPLVVELLMWLQAQNIVVRARHIPGCLNVIPPISSQSADIDRAESPSRNRESNFHSLMDPSGGHVCNCFKLPPSSVHVSDSGAMSPGSGCSVSGLAGEVDVHVSSVSPAQQGYSETTVDTGGRRNTDSPLVAKTGMFLHLLLLRLCVDHPLFFPYRRDLLLQQDQRYISDRKSYRLHAWRLSCDTTRQQAFQTRSLGLPRHLGDPQPIICTMASFLYSLFDTGLSPQTIKGYRTCLGSVLNRTAKAKVVLHRTISDMIASMELQRPRVMPVLPQWDLGIVLEALSKSPYEPLGEALFKHLTLKTVFLLAMALAGRRSELQALMFDHNYIQFKPKGAGVTLYFSREFMRKNQKPNQVNDL